MRRLKSRGVTCYLVTNGLLLESLADEVVDSGLDWIVVSIDSDKPAEHDRNRHVEGLPGWLLEYRLYRLLTRLLARAARAA